MKKFAVLVSFLIATMQLLTSQTKSQVVGSRENNAPSPKEIKPSTLTAGGFTSDVSLFTGTLNTSYSLGSVSTPSGLNFDLRTNYSSSLTGGDNTSATSGIPYGEGWNLYVPTVSVQYETFRNYTPEEIQHCQLYHTPFSNCPVQNHPPIASKDVYYNPERARNEGGSYYLNVQVNIPGVASERFNYVYEENNMAYFIPHTFEKFLEAKFDGKGWEVTAANGDYYVFSHLQYSQRSPSNQRVFYNNDQQLPYLSEMPEIIMNLVLPKW
ncbi:MAG TPA: hypothetical protein PKD91_00070, partial [Bacteroidia bacterium]|nr:hypothetical protein [Bacteroidia bacterium]